MMALYVFSLVLGGGFLGLSLLGDVLGGHGDVDLASDVAGADVDLGAESGGTGVGGHGDVVTGDAAGHGHHDVDHHGGVAAKIFSIRTVTYSLFGFGAVGTLLTWLWAGGAPVTIGVLAAGTGLASGSLVNAVFAWITRSESGTVEGEERYAGHMGRVTLPIAGSGGLIRVEKSGREVELRALPHASATDRGDPAGWKHVVVVEMEHGIARVAPLDSEQLLHP